MNGFMLQREMPGDEICADGHDDPPGQPGVEPDQQHPRAVQHHGHQPGGPVDLKEFLPQVMHGVDHTPSLPANGQLAKFTESRAKPGCTRAASGCSLQYWVAASKFSRNAS